MATNKVNTEKLTAFLNKARTAKEVAEKFTVTEATARKYLAGLANTGAIQAVGTKTTGTRGRPATQFQA